MIESNRQDSDEKTKKLTEDLTSMIASMMDHIKESISSPNKKDSPNSQDPTTVVPANKKAPPLEVGHSTKMVACGISKMRSSHQNYMNSSSIHNPTETLILTSITSKTTSICV